MEQKNIKLKEKELSERFGYPVEISLLFPDTFRIRVIIGKNLIFEGQGHVSSEWLESGQFFGFRLKSDSDCFTMCYEVDFACFTERELQHFLNNRSNISKLRKLRNSIQAVQDAVSKTKVSRCFTGEMHAIPRYKEFPTVEDVK